MNQPAANHDDECQEQGAQHLVGEQQTGYVETERREKGRYDGGEDDDRVGAQKRGGERVLGKSTRPRHVHILVGWLELLLGSEHGQDRQTEDHQRSDERDPAERVVVELELGRTVHPHSGKGEVERDIEQRQTNRFGHHEATMKWSGRLGRPAEVRLGQPVGREDLTGQLEQGCDHGDLEHRGRRGEKVGGVADILEERARDIERNGQRSGQKDRERQCLGCIPQAVPSRVGDAFGDLAQAASHGLSQEHDDDQQERCEEPVAAEPESDDRGGPQILERCQPTHGAGHVAEPRDDRFGYTPRPQDVGEKKVLDILELAEEVG